MKKHTLPRLILGGLFLALSAHAQFAIPVWGTDASGSIFNRFGTSGATSPGEFGNSEDTGGGGVPFDSATGTDARATFSSLASLSHDLSSFMEIGTRVETFQNSAAFAEGDAVERFTYLGGTTASFTIDLNLSGTLINSPNDPSPFAGNFGEVFVIISDADNLFGFESVTFGRFEIWTEDASASVVQSGTETILTDSLTFDIDPGQSFVVYARGGSDMYGEDGIADALSTLTVGFTAGPTGDLTQASVIPEPGAFAFLLGLGATLFTGLRRRR